MPDTPSDRPSIAEIAAFTRRLRDLTHAGRDADPAERDRFLADKRALFDRIAATDTTAEHTTAEHTAAEHTAAEHTAAEHTAAERTGAAGAVAEERHVRDVLRDRALVEDAVRYADHVGVEQDPWADYRTYTPDEAAAELIARGVPPDQAPGMVDRYVDAMTWDRGWSPQDQWQIDDDDLAEMTSPPGEERPEPATGWAPPAGATETEQSRASARAAAAELERRDQLARWDHTDAAADVDQATDGQARVIDVCNPIPGQEPTP